MLRRIYLLLGFTANLALLATVFVGLNSSAVQADYPEFPYPATDYTEPYRGQFHFTPQVGWMNDVNGIWYYNGLYHLTFQHYPHSTQGYSRHWGHAMSTDMIHWVQKPIMLEPDVNVPGDCWSGSVVVDTNNTSGLQTGSNPVLVAIYTATTKGTCLAYSNDLGKTWQSYSANPVNVGWQGWATRDPHVFWYAATGKWVCALYQTGITFYTSSNLKRWTKTSTFAWGNECPDIYELPVDDNQANKKWVLQDASGSYYIGQFDGLKFTPDSGGPYKMDVGPNFYAAQTFFRGTFPGSRVIQMGWLSTTTNTSPWNQAATFPVELKLKTSADGVRLTRTPITEISSIYGASNTWASQTLTSGQDLLAGTKGKCYDLTAEFDLTDATATAITFQLANKTVTYDLTNKTLLGKDLRPINNRIKVRILADWSMLEVFGNDGLFSWTEGFLFTPESNSLGLTVNGTVRLVSMEFHSINRSWPSVSLPRVFKSNLAGAWSTVSGSWDITADGAWGGNTGDGFYLNSQTDTDFTYEGDVKLLSDGGGALVFRANSNCSQAYCVSIDSRGVVKLWDPARGSLQTYPTTISIGTTYHLKVVTSGSNIKVYFNGGDSPAIDYTDSTPILSGQFGVNVFSGSAVLQNVNTGCKVATPTITLTPETNTVTMSCATPGAAINYTTDGRDPSSSSTAYANPMAITRNTCFRAKAHKSGFLDSDEASAAFAIADGSIAGAKKLSDGDSVYLPGKQLVAVPGNGVPENIFYIEEENRSCGLRFDLRSTSLGDYSPIVAQCVDAVGTMRTTLAGERYMNVGMMTYVSDGVAINPVGMNNRSFSMLSPGLLVTVWGKVADNTGTGYYTITDGSGDHIKVLCGAIKPTEPYVIATGIASSGSAGMVLYQR